jgi:uncharacterized membrane protein YbhN (UPF0104 family)
VSLLDRSRHPAAALAERRSHRWGRTAALVAAAVAVVFLGIPALAGVPARLIEGCGRWIAGAAVLELLSVAGFVIFFKLVFAPTVGWRHSVPAGLRALGASTLLPAGGLLGPTVGAWSATGERPSLAQLTRATVTFVILTSAPPVLALGVLGTLLWLGLASGPHGVAVTLLPAALAVSVITATWLMGRSPRRECSSSRRGAIPLALSRAARPVCDGVAEAQRLARASDWKLTGALAYSAFDLAVLWAAFHAYGHTPPLAVIGMGYLIGSLAGALPLPAGVGAVDGGLIGALVLYGAPLAPAAGAVLLYRGISLALPIALGALACLATPRRSRGRARARVRAQRGAASELATASAES